MEFVIGTAVMVVFLMAVVQIALAFHVRSVATTAARHGLDQARVTQGTAGDGEVMANQFLNEAGRGLKDRRVTVQRDPTRTTVRVQGTVVSVLPGFRVPVDVTVHGPTEQVTP